MQAKNKRTKTFEPIDSTILCH